MARAKMKQLYQSLSLFGLLMFQHVAHALVPRYLYQEDNPPILEYRGDNKNDFKTSTKPRIVEFYSPTCGGCQRFKPRYVELAKEMTKIYPQVEFYAVSCSPHKDECNQYKITSMPSLLAVSPNVRKEPVLLKRSMRDSKYGGYSVKTLLEGLGIMEDEDEQTQDEDEQDTQEALRQLENTKEDSKEFDDKDNLDDEDDDDDGNTQPENPQSILGAQKNLDDEDDDDDGNTKTQDPQSILQAHNVGVETNEVEVDVALDTDEDEDVDYEDEVAPDDSDGDADEDISKELDDDDDDDDNSISEDAETVSKKAFFGGATSGTTQALTQLRDVDKWKNILAEQRKEVVQDRRNRKVIKQYQSRKEQPNIFVPGNSMSNLGSTETMLANTPGTKEFEQRKRDIMERISKLQKTNALRPPRFQPKEPSSYFTKNNMPMVKQLKKETTVQKSIKRVPIMNRLVKVSPEEELYWDASHSFISGLRHNVFVSSEPLNAKKREALKGWLELLSIGLPPEWALHELVDELYSNLDHVTQSPERLERVLQRHEIPRKGWSPACNQGMMERGFSCGFWKLLHIVTIGIAEHRGGNNLIEAGVMDASSTRVFSPQEAASTIREYMAHFFGCVECRDYFLATYDECQFRRCTLADKSDSSDPAEWKQLALWMWAVHNDVSVMIANKRQRQGRFAVGSNQEMNQVKALWPSLATCVICFEEDGSWDEDAVFEHLEKTYWSLSLDPKTDRLLSFKRLDGSSSGNRFGLLLQFMVWMAVALILFTRRRVTRTSPFHVVSSPFRGAKVRKV